MSSYDGCIKCSPLFWMVLITFTITACVFTTILITGKPNTGHPTRKSYGDFDSIKTIYFVPTRESEFRKRCSDKTVYVIIIIRPIKAERNLPI